MVLRISGRLSRIAKLLVAWVEAKDSPRLPTTIATLTEPNSMPRPVMLAGLLGAAVGVPYVVDHSDQWQRQLQGSGASPESAESLPESPHQSPLAAASRVPDMPIPKSPGDHLYRSPAPLEGLPTYSLAEVLRMDVSKEWVYRRWARKSTGLAEPELFGIRVPLVSGTRMTDVAGSLTYYFNVAGQVEKIRLTGKTADTSELVNLLAGRYGFRPAIPLVAGEQLFRVESGGRVQSELKTWPESVLWSTSPHDSFTIDLEINRPGSGRTVERPLPPLQAIQTPPAPLPPLPGQQPPQPPGKPVFPGEVLVPSTAGSPQAAAQTSTAEAVPADAPVPKKQRKSPLRWPY
jgi:hypothetical protein